MPATLFAMNDDRRSGRRARIERSLRWLERYRPIVDDMQGFLAALEEPPPVDLMVPRGAERRREVAARLEARGLATRTFDWAPRHLRLESPLPGGALPEVVFGLAFRQGVVSSLPCRALDPHPGERILDLCAAPGGKTVLLASLAEDRARILAGDPSASRAGLLVQSLSRMGLTSVITVQQDGNGFPAAAPFDAILLDAPCTGEGIFRVGRPRYEPTGEQGVLRARALQRRLISRAADLLAPGGRMVYSTCSYAPEENEGVISDLLARRDDLRIEALPDGIPGSPGLTRWGEIGFHPDLPRARRLYPHQTGSWGFFLCLLRKDPDSGHYTSGSRREDRPRVEPVDDPEAAAELRAALEPFGVGREVLDTYHVMPRGKDLWILSRCCPAGSDTDVSRLKIVAPGLRALRRTPRGPRLPNGVLRALDRHLGARVVELEWDQALALLEEREQAAAPDAPVGQVALRAGGQVIGAGYQRGGRLYLELPKAWR
ncbi:MAG: RsmB/NOP family class I SAM-dependent RNA methyltransferase [Acidobacteriota bacterium]|nr:RsmB/NOP family class I SAM-dependent RNA methyltransferase [Acidobacteriota bacterium]